MPLFHRVVDNRFFTELRHVSAPFRLVHIVLVRTNRPGSLQDRAPTFQGNGIAPDSLGSCAGDQDENIWVLRVVLR